MRRGRSRSPRGSAEKWDSERISRTVVSFGRYSWKRPAHLHVDPSGAITLRNLMEVWGRSQGLEDEDVLDAVRKNMFHQGDVSSLRFAVVSDQQGNIVIRVNPRRTDKPQRRSRDLAESLTSFGKPSTVEWLEPKVSGPGEARQNTRGPECATLCRSLDGRDASSLVSFAPCAPWAEPKPAALDDVLQPSSLALELGVLTSSDHLARSALAPESPPWTRLALAQQSQSHVTSGVRPADWLSPIEDAMSELTLDVASEASCPVQCGQDPLAPQGDVGSTESAQISYVASMSSTPISSPEIAAAGGRHVPDTGFLSFAAKAEVEPPGSLARVSFQSHLVVDLTGDDWVVKEEV